MYPITLMRHGRPDVSRDAPIALSNMAEWIAAYDEAGVSEAAPPAAKAAASAAVHVFASPLPRAMDSLAKLGIEATQANPLFRELGLPSPPRVELFAPASLWVMALRLAWLAGYAKDTEPLSEARRRTHRAADRLIGAASHGPTLLMAHGATNWMISKALLRSGWHVTVSAQKGFWHYQVLHASTNQNAA